MLNKQTNESTTLMAKGTSSGKGKATAPKKRAPLKKPAPKKAPPKKVPTKKKGSQKRTAAEDSSDKSSDESSDESDHRPRKKKRTEKVGSSDHDDEVFVYKPTEEPEIMDIDDEAPAGHDSPNDSESEVSLQLSPI